MYFHYNKAILTKLFQNALLGFSWAEKTVGPGQVEHVKELRATRGARNECPFGIH